MLRFVDLEDDQGPDETLLAGIKPLPINRMMRQAGRKVNQDRIDNANFMGGKYSSPMTPALRKEGMERLERTQDAINNWDPIEASAKEDYNRMKGKMGPADAVELIQPIAPLDGEYKQSGSFPGV